MALTDAERASLNKRLAERMGEIDSIAAWHYDFTGADWQELVKWLVDREDAFQVNVSWLGKEVSCDIWRHYPDYDESGECTAGSVGEAVALAAAKALGLEATCE